MAFYPKVKAKSLKLVAVPQNAAFSLEADCKSARK
jgi:hypothetical protein